MSFVKQIKRGTILWGLWLIICIPKKILNQIRYKILNIPVGFLNKSRQIDNINEHMFFKNFGNDPIILDLGANKGTFSKKFIKKYDYSKLIMVEGNKYLINNIESGFMNERRVKIINAVVGPKAKKVVKFYLSRFNQASSMNKVFSKENYGNDKEEDIGVKMVTIKNIFDLFNLKKIDLIKMDVEGAEWDILENLRKKELDKIEQISVEFHDFKDPKLRKRTKQCIKRLKMFGYKFINNGTTHMKGSPYFNCLFYRK